MITNASTTQGSAASRSDADVSVVTHATDDSFQSAVLDSKQTVLVDFWAPWCGPCRVVGPVVEDVARELEGQVKVVKVNIDDGADTASRYSIRSIPSLLVFQEGRPVETLVGAVPKAKIMATLQKYR